MGKLLEDHLKGLDISIEEGVEKLDRAVEQARIWEAYSGMGSAAKVGFTSKEGDGKSAVFGELLSWGAGEAEKEGIMIDKFESYLSGVLANFGFTLKRC